jgi:SARP family transcriptional regulator, regulator of embCAB operon
VALPHDRSVSREHAAIQVDGGRPLAVDLGSRNGTYHNGERIPDGGVRLGPGDLLRCGDSIIAVTAGHGPTRAAEGTTL